MSEPSYPLWSDAPDPKLLASRDRVTGRLAFPAVPASSPLAHRYESVPVAAVGAVYSFTVIHPGPRSGESPFALGLVDFPGPVRVFGRFRGHERPTIGARCVARPDDRFGYVLDTASA